MRRIAKSVAVVADVIIGVPRVAVWVIPLALALVAAAAPRDSRIFCYDGPPTRAELEAYSAAHRGAYPPLPNPIVATYVLVEDGGLTYLRQSATRGNRRYQFVAAEPGRFDMHFYVRSGLSTVWNDEPAVMRSAGDGTLGLVWRNPTFTRYGWAFTGRQVTLPRWFLIGAGLSPALLLTARAVVRAHLHRRRRRRHICASCGYDLRATPERCPECGLEPGAARGFFVASDLFSSH